MPFFTPAQEEALHAIHRGSPRHEEFLAFLKGSFDTFLSRSVAPAAHGNDRQEIFAVETFRKLGELGFMALPYPEAYGGLDAPFSYYCAALESLAKADAGFALGVAIHGTMCDGIVRFAREALKERYLPDLLSGKKIGAFALSEPDCGSDARNLKTRYTFDEQGGCYRLTGRKYWITNAMDADLFFVVARSPGDEISAFLVERTDAPSFTRAKIAEKMGVRGSNTAELVFEEHPVPADHLVGEAGSGFRYAMEMLNGGRITIAAWATGIAQAAYEKLLKYAHERLLFGRYLKDLDNTKRELSEMTIEIEASRLLAYHAALHKSLGLSIIRPAAVAKVKATETAVYVAQRAIQLCGGYGYVAESKIERHLRDALLGRIGEGANELLKIVVIPRILYQAFEDDPIRESW